MESPSGVMARRPPLPRPRPRPRPRPLPLPASDPALGPTTRSSLAVSSLSPASLPSSSSSSSSRLMLSLPLLAAAPRLPLRFFSSSAQEHIR